MITREKFIAATGAPPVGDDLERCNCPEAGKPGHLTCGWNVEHDKPQFWFGPRFPVSEEE